MATSPALRIGVDLGGTKVEYIALDQDNQEIFRERTNAPRSYDETLKAIAEMVHAIEDRFATQATLGVGMPGAISRATGLVKNAPNSQWMIGHPFDMDLAKILGKAVPVENDANCFALSEASDGAAAGAEVVFGVIIGTGCGSGITVNGRPISGINAIAGEFGHNPLPWARPEELPGPDCGCGKQGCNETWLAGQGLVRAYGKSLTAEEIAARAERGEKKASEAISLYSSRLARALASVINILDPDVIVLGGGLSNIPMLYELVPAMWGAYVFSDAVDTRLLQAKHGDSSGVRGAAWL